eukprot:SAG11_NODE_25769_length_354_cov_0.811765_1_plen_40_part_10
MQGIIVARLRTSASVTRMLRSLFVGDVSWFVTPVSWFMPA